MLCGFKSQLCHFLAVWFGTGHSCSAPSLPQFSHLQNGHNDVTYLLRLAGSRLHERAPGNGAASFMVFVVLTLGLPGWRGLDRACRGRS